MIKPFGNQILVEPEKQNTVIAGYNSLFNYGQVISIGDEVKKIKVGDKIGFIVWGLNDIEIDEKKYYFVPEDDKFILGIIE